MNLRSLFTGRDAQRAPASVAAIREYLVDSVARKLEISREDLDIHLSLLDYGLDSIDATTMSGELGRMLGRKLSPLLLWDYPTIDELARHLAGEEVAPRAPDADWEDA